MLKIEYCPLKIIMEHYFVSTIQSCYIPPDGKEYGKHFSFEQRKLNGTFYTDNADTTIGQICNPEELKKKIHLLDKNVPIVAEFYERPMLLVLCDIPHSKLIQYIDSPHTSYYQDFV